MPFFQYEAIDETGKSVKGILDAESLQAANNVMSLRGLIPLKLEEEKEDQAGALLNKIKALFEQVNPRELILFTKQLRAMLNAGVPVVKSMQILESQSESKTLQKAAKAIYYDIQHGVSLSEAFGKHPNVFSRLF